MVRVIGFSDFYWLRCHCKYLLLHLGIKSALFLLELFKSTIVDSLFDLLADSLSTLTLDESSLADILAFVFDSDYLRTQFLKHAHATRLLIAILRKLPPTTGSFVTSATELQSLFASVSDSAMKALDSITSKKIKKLPLALEAFSALLPFIEANEALSVISEAIDLISNGELHESNKDILTAFLKEALYPPGLVIPKLKSHIQNSEFLYTVSHFEFGDVLMKVFDAKLFKKLVVALNGASSLEDFVRPLLVLVSSSISLPFGPNSLKGIPRPILFKKKSKPVRSLVKSLANLLESAEGEDQYLLGSLLGIISSLSSKVRSDLKGHIPPLLPSFINIPTLFYTPHSRSYC